MSMSDQQRKAMGALQHLVNIALPLEKSSAWHDQWKAAAQIIEEYIKTSFVGEIVPLAEGPKVVPARKPKGKR